MRAVLHPWTFVQIAGVRLDLDPTARDPITALGACADQVTRCFSPPERSLDQCVYAVRACATTAPWNEQACCPVACRDGYRQMRDAGSAPFDAFQRVYLDAPTCVAGVVAMTTEPPSP